MFIRRSALPSVGKRRDLRRFERQHLLSVIPISRGAFSFWDAVEPNSLSEIREHEESRDQIVSVPSVRILGPILGRKLALQSVHP